MRNRGGMGNRMLPQPIDKELADDQVAPSGVA
jgi:hypothetical protein